MNRKYALAAVLLLIICLILPTACTAEAPAAAAPQTQPQEAPKVSAVPAVQPQPAKAAEPTPAPEIKPSGAVVQAVTEQPPVKEEDKASIQVEGAGIEKSLSLSLEDLKAMEDHIFEDDFFSLNSYGTKEYFHFKGVKLSAVLQEAGLKEGAAAVTVAASDGYKLELTLEQALREDYIDEQDSSKKYPVIIAWQENGSDYDAEAGNPFRLVIGQKEAGDVNKPQWVMNIAKITVN